MANALYLAGPVNLYHSVSNQQAPTAQALHKEELRKEREERSKLVSLLFQTTKADFDKGFTFLSTAFTLFTAATTALVGGIIALWDRQHGCSIGPKDPNRYIPDNYAIQVTALLIFYTMLDLGLIVMFFFIISAMTKQAELMLRMRMELLAQSPYKPNPLEESQAAADLFSKRHISDRYQIRVAAILLGILEVACVFAGVFGGQYFSRLLFCRDTIGMSGKQSVAIGTTFIALIIALGAHCYIIHQWVGKLYNARDDASTSSSSALAAGQM